MLVTPRKDFLSVGVDSLQLYHVSICPFDFQPCFLAWCSIGRRQLHFLDNLDVGLPVGRHLEQSVAELTVLQVGEVVAVLDGEGAAVKIQDLHRAPHLADGIERAFLFHVRTYNAVAAEVTHAVNDTIHIRAHYTLVHQVPQETAGTAGIRHHQLPVVLQSGTMTSVIQSVQELRRHEDFLLPHILRCLTP